MSDPSLVIFDSSSIMGSYKRWKCSRFALTMLGTLFGFSPTPTRMSPAMGEDKRGERHNAYWERKGCSRWSEVPSPTCIGDVANCFEQLVTFDLFG